MLTDMDAPVDTHCPYCSLQCGMTLRPVTVPVPADQVPSDQVAGDPVASSPVAGSSAGGEPIDANSVVVGDRPDFPVNRGALCGKGRTAAEVLAHRLTSPLVRVDGELRETSWSE